MHLTLWFLSLLLLIPAFAGQADQENPPGTHPRPPADYLEQETVRLASLVSSSEEEIRLDSVIRLATLRTPGAAAALTTASSDESEKVRAAAVTGLGLIGNSSNAPTVAARLTQDKSVLVRKSAAYALARLKAPESAAALAAALHDKELEVRSAAAVAMGEYGDPALIAALTGALSDTSPFVREQATRALGRFGRAAAASAPALITLLAADSHGVRLHAAIALGQIGDRSALPALKAASHHQDPYLSKAALQAIKLIEEQRD